MGQSTSTLRRESNCTQRSKVRSKASICHLPFANPTTHVNRDYTSDLPDECLEYIFRSLGTGDRKCCSLVCRRWLRIEGQSRHRLALNAQLDLFPEIPSMFSRFDSVTKLVLKCERRCVSIGDDGLILISSMCRSLVRLKLRSCREITDSGMGEFAKNCRGLKKFSCGSCMFGGKGVNAVLENCGFLEELTIKRLRGLTDGRGTEMIQPGKVLDSLRMVCLKELYNGQCFGNVIIGAKNLKSLKLFRCSGDWDVIFQGIKNQVNHIVEIHLERIQVSDVGLGAISTCLNLEILRLVKIPECTNHGLELISKRCRMLRKLHIDGWKANRIGDDGLISVGKNCCSLQELVLIGVNPTKNSLHVLGSNCRNLERLALCGSDTVGDPEITCIATKCLSLKKLCIKNCPVSDQGMEALADGCPNLVKVKVKKCKGVTCEGADWLRSCRVSLAVNLDLGEPENQDVSASEEVQEIGTEGGPSAPSHTCVSSNGRQRSTSLKSILELWGMRSAAACTIKRLLK